MAAILYRFADFLGVLPNGMDTVLNYPDADSISDYAKTAALYCQTTGIITGCEGGVFAPQVTATRAEVATNTKICRACARLMQAFEQFPLSSATAAPPL